jgi:hypothetical protein
MIHTVTKAQFTIHLFAYIYRWVHVLIQYQRWNSISVESYEPQSYGKSGILAFSLLNG